MSNTNVLDQIQQRHKKSLLNKNEAAQELGGISKTTLDRLRKSGELKSKTIGGGIFFRISDIASFIESY